MSGTDMNDDLPEMGPDMGRDGEDDILAAEFALGVLPADEHAALARRAERDVAFARLVGAWEDRLLPMAEGFAPMDLPPAVKRALDLRLFGQDAPAHGYGGADVRRPGFWSSLALWRGLAGVTTAAFLLAVTLPGMMPPAPNERLAASLRADGSTMAYLVVYDSATGRVSLAHMTGTPVEGRDFQLWVARGSEAPMSVGIIPAGSSMEMELSAQIRAMMTSAAHMAISLEPIGGSPTGQPTGPVMAVGDLMDI